jgi:hypothetical protein
MDNNRNRLVLVGIVAFIVGWAIGLFIFGWVIWPVEFTGAGPQHLLKSDQDIYLIALADLYAFDNNQQRVQDALGNWQNSSEDILADQAICNLAEEVADPAQTSRLIALAAVLNNAGCPPPGTVPGADEAGSGRTGVGTIILICGLLALLGAIVGGIFLILQRRGGQPPSDSQNQVDLPMDAPVAESAEVEQQVTPIARFETTYARGHDTYDDSFSIENANGDFLGECGVGLSETIGTDAPKNVTAFEVWLFDKNDIRTVTKVIMSDHSFFDEAIKAKLAPKGEPVLARPNETIVLETASLIVNAEITDMEYGTGLPQAQSYFERFTVELSAWAKEGDFEEPDVQGRIDDMLEF